MALEKAWKTQRTEPQETFVRNLSAALLHLFGISHCNSNWVHHWAKPDELSWSFVSQEQTVDVVWMHYGSWQSFYSAWFLYCGQFQYIILYICNL